MGENLIPVVSHTTQGRIIYVRDNDSGRFWSIGSHPNPTTFDRYECRHGFGYTVIEASVDGIDVTWKIFIPTTDSLEIWQVSVSNQSDKKRRLSLFWLIDFAIASNKPIYSAQFTHNAVCVRGRAASDPTYFLASSKEVSSFETIRSTFLGGGENFAAPVAVTEGKCSRSLASGEPLLAVLEKNSTLGAKATLNHELFVGAAHLNAKTTIASLLKPYQKTDAVGGAFAAILTWNETILQHHRLRTGQTAFDHYYNGFLSYQNLATFRFPEVTIGQSAVTITSLARAVRAGLRYQPKISQEHLTVALASVMKDGRLSPYLTSHSNQLHDSLLLAKLCVEVVKETGDLSWLRQHVAHYDGGTSSVLEHITRLIELVISHIRHHVVVIDGIESTEMSAKTISVLKELISLHDLLGDNSLEKKYRTIIDGLSVNIDKRFWQTPFYERQRDEAGRLPPKKGPHTFDLATQIAVMRCEISADRTQRIINAIKKQWSHYVPNISPPYSTSTDHPLSVAVPGRGQNGSVDLRAISQLAELAAVHGDADYAWFLLQSIMPITEQRDFTSPFWQADFYNWDKLFSAQPAAGRYGTADALTSAIQETILGIQPTFGGLRIDPHLPKSWRQVEISRHFRGADYHIRIQNPLRVSSGVDRIVVDGIRVIGNTIRPFSTGVHFVEVILG